MRTVGPPPQQGLSLYLPPSFSWGWRVYALVGARCVKGGLGHDNVGEVQVCGWAGTCASWVRHASSWGVVVRSVMGHVIAVTPVTCPHRRRGGRKWWR